MIPSSGLSIMEFTIPSNSFSCTGLDWARASIIPETSPESIGVSPSLVARLIIAGKFRFILSLPLSSVQVIRLIGEAVHVRSVNALLISFSVSKPIINLVTNVAMVPTSLSGSMLLIGTLPM